MKSNDYVLKEAIKTWRVELTCTNESLGEVGIQYKIFQGYALSPLLFVMFLISLVYMLRRERLEYKFIIKCEKKNHLLLMEVLKLYAKSQRVLDSMVQTVRISSKEIRMEFGTEKCAMLVMVKGKKKVPDGVHLPDGKTINSLKDGEGYKYLGVLDKNEG